MNEHTHVSSSDNKLVDLEFKDYTYRVSHDLGAPIRAMIEFSKLLALDYSDKLDSEAKEYLALIVENGQKAQAMMEGLLRYSWIDSQQNPYSLINTDALIKQVETLLGKRIQNTGATLTINKLPDIFGDIEQIRTVFCALVDNAIKFQANQNTPHLIISAEQKEQVWQFSIQDNGIGIKEQFREKIFNLFAKLHPDEQFAGTGIGLTLAKKIVQRHGGTIWFESVPDQGTVFYFTLPRDHKI